MFEFDANINYNFLNTTLQRKKLCRRYINNCKKIRSTLVAGVKETKRFKSSDITEFIQFIYT